MSDAELVHRALGAATPDERKAAFTGIADRHHLTVLRQCAHWFPHPEEAQDVCQAAFEAAFTLLAAGKGPERPGKLAGWLIEIAQRRGQEYRRKDKPAAVSWAILPEGQSLDQMEDDEEPRSGSALRRAHANRLVETVVASLTVRQQQVYQLRYVGELTGKQVAERLSFTGKAASNEITHIQDLIANGFGALILFQEGRKYCPGTVPAWPASLRPSRPPSAPPRSPPRSASGSSATSRTAASAMTAAPATPSAASWSARTPPRWFRSCSPPISATASERSSTGSPSTPSITRPVNHGPAPRYRAWPSSPTRPRYPTRPPARLTCRSLRRTRTPWTPPRRRNPGALHPVGCSAGGWHGRRSR